MIQRTLLGSLLVLFVGPSPKVDRSFVTSRPRFRDLDLSQKFFRLSQLAFDAIGIRTDFHWVESWARTRWDSSLVARLQRAVESIGDSSHCISDMGMSISSREIARAVDYLLLCELLLHDVIAENTPDWKAVYAAHSRLMMVIGHYREDHETFTEDWASGIEHAVRGLRLAIAE